MICKTCAMVVIFSLVVFLPRPRCCSSPHLCRVAGASVRAGGRCDVNPKRFRITLDSPRSGHNHGHEHDNGNDDDDDDNVDDDEKNNVMLILSALH